MARGVRNLIVTKLSATDSDALRLSRSVQGRETTAGEALACNLQTLDAVRAPDDTRYWMMENMMMTQRIAAALFFGLVLSVSSAASAECTSDADCADGYSCELIGGIACADAPPCIPGEECVEPEPCEAEEVYACLFVPPSCSSDADCEPGLVCETFDSFDCPVSSPPCPADAECPEPVDAEDDCVEESESYCVPPYFASCATDADCGPGFACVADEICSCSGSAGSGSSGSSGGSTDPVPSPDAPDQPQNKDGEDCSCEPTGDFYCELIPVECVSDADCGEGLSCVTGPADDVVCTATPDGEASCEEPSETVSYCIPDGYEDYVEAGLGGRGAEVASADDTASGGTDAPTSAQENSAAASDSDDESGGCSATGSGGGSGWLLALAMVGLVRRRRSA